VSVRASCGREARLVGHGKQLCVLVRTHINAWLGMGRTACGVRPAIARCEPFVGLRQRAQLDAGDLARRAQPRAGGMSNFDVSGKRAAIFEADHSSSPLLKVAATFLTAPAGLPSRPGRDPCAASRVRVF
jgi:hypothetical protein